MKHIILLLSVVTLLATSGCIFPGHGGGGEYRGHDEYRGHGEYREHSEYREYPEPAVVVRIHPD
ncbi:MAG TPA: hypothetical protein VNZ64_11495 [Candidatus Acidoferrum sp.]|nr:hypothetical protein [Candidatus Acidoferrum sp.]